MRCLYLILMLLLLISPQVSSQQQYTEGACILLQQQIDRFSYRKQSSQYRSAMREYERFCRQPRALPQLNNSSNNDIIERDTNEVEAAVAPAATRVAIAPVASETTVLLSRSAETQTNKLTEPVLVKPAAKVTQVVATAVTSQDVTSELSVPEPLVTTLDAELLSDAPPDYANSAIPSEWLLMVLNNTPLIAANIVALLLVVFLLTSWFGLNLPGFKGVFAEYKLNRLLRWRLSRQYQHFRKLKLLTAKGELIIVDHIVLSPFGIFVITVKGERGRISGSETQANWTRQYFGRKKQLMNPLHQNFKNVQAVKHLLHLQGDDAAKLVHSVAAFTRQAKFEVEMPANVTYVDAVSAYLKQFTEHCLTDEQQQRFLAQLRQASTEN